MYIDERPTPAPGPSHVAIIMDGNGRWATSRGLPRLAGHKRGAERVREIVESCPDLGITHLTLFAFSTENWSRPASEVTGLMRLFRRYIKKEGRGWSRRARACASSADASGSKPILRH